MAFEHVFGRPDLVIDGVMEVGPGVAISARPIATHIRVASSGKLRIGKGVTIAHGVGIHAGSSVVIEDGVVIGPFVTIMDMDFHGLFSRDTTAEARPILIGRGVRLGAGAIVLRGVTIAPGAEILPGAVVARSIFGAGVYGGVPARPQRSAPAFKVIS